MKPFRFHAGRLPDGRRLRVAVGIASLCVMLVCAAALVFLTVVQPARADAGIDAARAAYRGEEVPASASAASSAAPGAGAASEAGAAPASGDLGALRKINGDVRGWISIPGTVIDYPVLLPPASSPDYYLHRDWRGEQSRYGSVFFDAGSGGADARNRVLYGHSMKDGRMFAALLHYAELGFYRAHPVVYLNGDGGRAAWKIFAVIKVNTDPSQGAPFNYRKTSFTSDDAFLEYLYGVRVRSVLDLPVDLSPSDPILTLSTCSYEFDGFRTAVLARRTRPGESESVETALASANARALYPDCWYLKYGGSKPALPDFKRALADGAVPWLKR